MNTQVDILARLLQLFPVQQIKERWQLKGRKEEIAREIARKSGGDEVKQFAHENAGLTKQVIYFCQPTHLSNTRRSVLPEAELVSRIMQGGTVEHFYLIELVYDVVLSEPLEEAQLKFLWPVRIVFEQSHFRVHVTMMEKNVASYFPENRIGLSRGKNLEEWQIINKICEALGLRMEDCKLDFNKGIKALWKNDLFDSLTARWKEPNDTTTKSMDKDRLLKRDNPEAYKAVIKSPLLKTAFRFLEKSDKFPDHFWADPTHGELVISTFCENVGVAENVIREILTHN